MIGALARRPAVRAGLKCAAVYVVCFAAMAFLLFASPWGHTLQDLGNRAVSAGNVHLLRAMGIDASLDGTYIHTSTFSVLIVDACNGTYALVYALPACLCLPFSLRRRLLGCLLVLIVTSAVNQARLATEMVVGSLYPDHFDAFEAVWFRFAYWSLVLITLWYWATSQMDAHEASAA